MYVSTLFLPLGCDFHKGGSLIALPSVGFPAPYLALNLAFCNFCFEEVTCQDFKVRLTAVKIRLTVECCETILMNWLSALLSCWVDKKL